ncbi:hypothetical protein MHYP_G00078450 [Metynnis hypsauchen]
MSCVASILPGCLDQEQAELVTEVGGWLVIRPPALWIIGWWSTMLGARNFHLNTQTAQQQQRITSLSTEKGNAGCPQS